MLNVRPKIKKKQSMQAVKITHEQSIHNDLPKCNVKFNGYLPKKAKMVEFQFLCAYMSEKI